MRARLHDQFPLARDDKQASLEEKSELNIKTSTNTGVLIILFVCIQAIGKVTWADACCILKRRQQNYA
jgi:hypothetical protein